MPKKKKRGPKPLSKKEPEKTRRPWDRRRYMILGGAVLGVLVLGALSAWLIVHGYLSKINYSDGRQTPDAAAVQETDLPEEQTPAEELPPPEDDGEEKSSDIRTAAPDLPEETADPEELEAQRREQEAEASLGEVTNILLIGSDTRVAGQPGRSDSMMLLTINRTTETLSLTSLMRDMYVDIPGHYRGRINTAFAMGGEALLMDTIEQDFGVRPDYYATIDFYSFIAAIDALGGIRLDISRDEFYGVNYAISKYNKDLGLPFGSGYLTEYGEDILLTGKQALGYARNRQFRDGDFSRTEHQRILLRTLYDRVKAADLAELDSVLDAFLPGITTNMPESEMLRWMLLVPKIMKYQLVTARIPVEGAYQETWMGEAAVLTVNYEKNAQALHDIIYGTGDAAQDPAA